MRGFFAALGALLIVSGCASQTEIKRAEPPPYPSWPSTAPVTPVTPIVPTTERDEMSGWKQEVGPSMAALGAAFGAVADAAKAGDYASTRDACRQLDTASSGVAAHLPAPDVGLNATLEEMTGNASAAARLCMGFDEDTPASVISQATKLITKSTGQIEAATQIINGLG